MPFRPYRPEDLDDFLAFHTHPEVAATMGKPPMTREQAARYLATRAAATGDERATWQGYAIERDGRVVGEVGLYLQPNGTEADLGFALHPEHQGQGLATQAARALVAHAFETLGLLTITAHTDPDNHRSARVLERLGMEKVGEGYRLEKT